MSRECHYTGKRTSFGNQMTRRGKAKYLGGVGRKITGITRRDGKVTRIRVSTKAIKMGLVQKRPKRSYKKPAEKTTS
jgi:large subunit ribosomal protein L28